MKIILFISSFFILINLNAQTCDSINPIDMTGAALWGDGSPESCTQDTLQTLLNVGGKIIFNGGSKPFTLYLTKSLEISAYIETVIDGNGLLTISGVDSVRIFHRIGSANQNTGVLFGVQKMSLVNGKASDELGGGAISSNAYGSLMAYNVFFANNQGQLSNSDACGAVHTIMQKEVIIYNCTFINNMAANGGAVGSIGSSEKIINCTFTDNVATGTGGTFSYGGSGGSVYVDGVAMNGINKYIEICNCIFNNSMAGYQAGALNIIFYTGDSSSGNINKCIFENDSCLVNNGGACYLMNGPFGISNCAFINNTSPASGGAAWFTNTNIDFSNCTFYQNKAYLNDSGVTSGLGGALAHSGGTDTDFTVTNCTFANNKAGDFASVIFNLANLTLINCLFYNNIAGSTFQNNAWGGAYINTASTIQIQGKCLNYPYIYNIGTMDVFDPWTNSVDVMNNDPLLLNIGDYGGNTLTMALLPNSPVIGQANPVHAPTTDQRGYTRKANPDIGAYEFIDSARLTIIPASIDFGDLAFNTDSVKSYTIKGDQLVSDLSLTVKAPFSLSLKKDTIFSQSLSIPNALLDNGTIIVYVKAFADKPDTTYVTEIKNETSLYTTSYSPLLTVKTHQNQDTSGNVIENSSKISFSVSPNPFRDIIKIDLQNNFNLNNTFVSIYDIYGKLIIKKKILYNITDINLTFLSNGMYIIRISNNNTTLMGKIIKE